MLYAPRTKVGELFSTESEGEVRKAWTPPHKVKLNHGSWMKPLMTYLIFGRCFARPNYRPWVSLLRQMSPATDAPLVPPPTAAPAAPVSPLTKPPVVREIDLSSMRKQQESRIVSILFSTGKRFVIL